MGAALPKPCLSKVVERSCSDFYFSSCVSVNGYRTAMEDAHMMTVHDSKEAAFFGVFDGHSGDQCSTWLAQKVPEALKSLPAKGVGEEQIKAKCQALDEEFLRLPCSQGMGGSTAVFCSVFKNGRLQVANVGDSRLLHCRRGEILFSTVDHKPMDTKEKERVLRAGGTVNSGRIDGDLAVSRAFGDKDFKQQFNVSYAAQRVIAIPDVTELKWEDGDVLIIACDGVFEGSFSNLDVCRFVFEQLGSGISDTAVVCSRVCDEAIQLGSKDNITCMIVVLRSSPDFVKQFGVHSFVPGPPFSRTSEESRLVYAQMATMAGYTLPEALEKRYELLMAREKRTLNLLPPIMQEAFRMVDEVEVGAEREFFLQGPAPGNSKAYFEALSNSSR